MFLVGVIAFAASTGPTFGEDEARAVSLAEIEEIEQEIARMDEQLGEVSKAGGAITCGDDYCKGTYEDLVSFRWERDDGYSGYGVTSAVEAAVQASTHNCLNPEIIVLKHSSDTGANRNATVNRWLADSMLAEIMDREVQIQWKNSGGGWPVCILARFFVWPKP